MPVLIKEKQKEYSNFLTEVEENSDGNAEYTMVSTLMANVLHVMTISYSYTEPFVIDTKLVPLLRTHFNGKYFNILEFLLDQRNHETVMVGGKVLDGFKNIDEMEYDEINIKIIQLTDEPKKNSVSKVSKNSQKGEKTDKTDNIDRSG